MKKKILLLTALLALCVTPCLSACGSSETNVRDSETKQTRVIAENKDDDENCPDGNCKEDGVENRDEDKDLDGCPHCKRGMPHTRRRAFKIPAGGEIRIFEITFNEFPFPRHAKPAPDEPEIPVPEDPEQPSTETGD